VFDKKLIRHEYLIYLIEKLIRHEYLIHLIEKLIRHEYLIHLIEKLIRHEYLIRLMYKIFTDGACTRNGKPDARASYGVVITGCEFGAVGADENMKLSGFVAPASNNRGELTAILVALQQSLLILNTYDIEIVSDSLISIKTFNEWLPKRKTKGTASEMMNYDLISEIDTLLTENGKVKNVKFTHVNSHRTITNENELGNSLADLLCTKLLSS
jgi:ribonuclease HI